MEEKIIQLKVETKGTEQVDNLDKSIKKAEGSTKKLSNETRGVTQNLDRLSGGAISSFKNMTTGLKSATLGFKGLRGAIIATGIGALVVIIASVVEWFSNFEQGVQFVTKAINTLQGTVNAIVGSFGKLLKGDVKGFFKDVAEGAESAWKETEKLFEAQERIFNLQRDSIVENAELNAELNLLARNVRDTTLSFEERLKAQQRINDVSEQLLQNEKAQIEAEQEIIRSQIALENNYEARRQLELQLEQSSARLIKIENDLTLQRDRASQQERRIFEEQEAIEKTRLKEAQARAEELRKIRQQEIDAQLKLEEEYNKQLEQLRVSNLTDAEEKIRQETEIKLREIREKYGRETELEKELIAQRDAQLDELRIAKEEKEAEDELKRLERIKAIQDEFEELTELERIDKEEEKRLLELEQLNATEEEKQRIRDFYAQERNALADEELAYQQKLDQMLLQSKKQAFGNLLGATALALGEQSKLGKKFAIAQALWNTYQGVSGALSDRTTPSFFVRLSNAGVALATGLASVRNIKKTNFGGSGGGASSSASNIRQSQASAPTFNIQDANEGNQIADALAQQSERPIQAYVVGSTMRTQEALDRNIEQSATIG